MILFSLVMLLQRLRGVCLFFPAGDLGKRVAVLNYVSPSPQGTKLGSQFFSNTFNIFTTTYIFYLNISN